MNLTLGFVIQASVVGARPDFATRRLEQAIRHCGSLFLR